LRSKFVGLRWIDAEGCTASAATPGPSSCRGSHIGATILHPNKKVLDFQGIFVFLGKKNNPFHHCTFSPTLWT